MKDTEPEDRGAFPSTNSHGAIDVWAEGEEDTTVRPCPPNIPRFWPTDRPLPGKPTNSTEGEPS